MSQYTFWRKSGFSSANYGCRMAAQSQGESSQCHTVVWLSPAKVSEPANPLLVWLLFAGCVYKGSYSVCDVAQGYGEPLCEHSERC